MVDIKGRVRYLFAVAAMVIMISCGGVQPPQPCDPVPSKQHMEWQEMEKYAFLHYSINTYTDEEWGYGDEPASLFNPTRLDARQWARVCKESGMKGIILTAKHHCGFCLWPSEYTEYSVKNSPWKDGKGDVVRELAEACKEYGLKYAVYLSPWDRNHPEYAEPGYIDYFHNQLRELLTQYGDMFEVWFDGANGGTGYYGGADERRKIDTRTYYRWPETYKLIRSLQPDILIWNDGGERGDLRWVGTEDGYVGETNWSLLRKDGPVPYDELHHGVEDGNAWVPGEVNTSIRPGWFYHTYEDNKVKSLDHLMSTYYKSVGRNGTLLLNYPITPEGLIDKRDSIMGIAFENAIREAFKENLAEKAVVTASNVRGGSRRYAAARVTDGKKDTYWATDDSVRCAEIMLQFPEKITFNRFLVQEYIELGQRVKEFDLEAFIDGEWKSLTDAYSADSTLTTIGYKRIICFPSVTSDKIRFSIKDAKACPVIRNIGVYDAPEIVEPFVSEESSEVVLPSHDWKVVVDNVSELDWRKALDEKVFSVWKMPSGLKEMTVDLRKEEKFNGFYYQPSRKTRDGMMISYEFSVSSDGMQWEKVASGEFSNIVNNPIRQFVYFPERSAKYVRLAAGSLSEGESAAVSEFGLVMKNKL